MRELKLLLKAEFKHVLDTLNPKNRVHSGSKRKSIAFAAVMFFASAMILFYAAMYSDIMARAFLQIDALYLLPALMFTASCIIMLFTTVYKVKGTIFGFNDYDFLMSLPIKTSTIVFSRLLVLYSINIVFVFFLMLPAAGFYVYYALPGVSFYIGFLSSLFFVPMVPIIAASVIGLLIHLAASRFRHKNIVNLFITLSLFMGIMLLSFNANTFIINAADIGQTVMKAVSRFYPLAVIYTNGVCKADFFALFLFIFISAAAFACFAFLVGKKFKALNTLLGSSRTTRNYKMTSVNVSPPFTALYKRELKRYFSSVNYVLNTGVGVVLFTMSSVALIFMGSEKLETLIGIPGINDIISRAGPVAVSFFIVMTCSTACAISLEGKSLWIVKSMPVSTKSVFLSKAAVNLTLSIPAIIINASLFQYIFRLDFEQAVLLFLVPAAYAFFTAFGGLALNLLFPNFTWSNEITVIKQGAAVMLAALLGIVSVAVPLVVMFTLKQLDAALVTWATFIVLLAADAVIYRYVMKQGVKVFKTF